MRLFYFLIISTIAIFVVMLATRRYYNIAIWKIIIMSILSIVSGMIGTSLMFYIESGRWGGLSLFGTIFFAPVLMSIFSIPLRVPVLHTLDIITPAQSVVLAILKVKCYLDECCYGKIIHVNEDGTHIRFPIQLIEAFAFIILMVISLLLIRKRIYKGKIYMYYMIIYGCVRFVLNCFRDTVPFVWKLPAGNFWALVSIILGIIILKITKHYLIRKMR